MDGWMDGWVDGRMGGWMDGWMRMCMHGGAMEDGRYSSYISCVKLGLHPHVIKLLEDLATGMTRRGGCQSGWQTGALPHCEDGCVARLRKDTKEHIGAPPALFHCLCRPYAERGPPTAAPRQAVWRTASGGALPTDLISRVVAVVHVDNLA
eukprot:354670-Chlamydomonas_euryale.AAC.6